MVARSACIEHLERLLNDVQRQESLAHMTQAEQEAIKAFDSAVSKIEEFATKAAKPSGSGLKPVPDPKPMMKPRCVIKPVEFVGKGYLETPKDVEEFLMTLRKKLEEAIASGQRIQIR